MKLWQTVCLVALSATLLVGCGKDKKKGDKLQKLIGLQRL